MAGPDSPELWLVRHGETEWSRSRRHTGRTDIPLTPAGEDAARSLAPRLAGVEFDLQLASPLVRAWHTAELAGLSPQPEPLAMEWDYGIYDGRTSKELLAEDPRWSIWDQPVPNGETLDEVAKRADEVIARVQSQSKDRAILVSHAHFIRVLAARWVGEHPVLARNLALDTATVSVLSWDRGIPVLLHWNS